MLAEDFMLYVSLHVAYNGLNIYVCFEYNKTELELYPI